MKKTKSELSKGLIDMISLSKNFLFIHVPKTGGNSIQNILKVFSDDQIVSVNRHQDGIERFELRNDKYNITKHSTLLDYKRVIEPEYYEAMYKFATIRNPWDMMISFYFSPHRNVKKWSRRKFFKLLASVRPLSYYITINDYQNIDENIDYLMRFERLEEDFQVVCKKLSIPYTNLPIRNKSQRMDYAKYYDAEMIEKVESKFKEEIRYGEYEFKKR